MSKQLKYGVWSRHKYFTLLKEFSEFREVWISAAILIERFNITLKTIRNGVSAFGRNKSRHWMSFNDHEAVMINYGTIPANTLRKKKLPENPNKVIELLRATIADYEDINRQAEHRDLYRQFKDAYENRWPPHLKLYKTKISDMANRILYAKCHALIEAILEAVKEKWPNAAIFDCYALIRDNNTDLKFYSNNIFYFWKKIKFFKGKEIENFLVHGSKGVARENATKMTGQIKAFIRVQLRKSKRLTLKEILDRIEKKFEVSLSKSSIHSVYGEDKNAIDYFRNGEVYSRINSLPKLTREWAEGPGEQFQGDFYKTQFVCRDQNGRVIRLWLYCVIDVFSKKIVGFTFGETLEIKLAIDAFRMAFTESRYLPEEILVDRDVLYRKIEFKRFRNFINELGVIITKCPPKHPTWRPEIESFFASFQKLFSGKKWYIGEGVKSKNKSGNPAPEYIDFIKKKQHLMITSQQMKIELKKNIQTYNSTPRQKKDIRAPDDYFRLFVSARTNKLEQETLPLLFWSSRKLLIKDDARIDLSYKGEIHTYQIIESETLWMHKNNYVRVSFNPEDLSHVFIFTLTREFISKIELRMVLKRNNKDEVLAKHREIIRKSLDYARFDRDNDIEVMNGRPPLTRKDHDADTKKKIKKLKIEKAEKVVMNVSVQN